MMMPPPKLTIPLTKKGGYNVGLMVAGDEKVHRVRRVHRVGCKRRVGILDEIENHSH